MLEVLGVAVVVLLFVIAGRLERIERRLAKNPMNRFDDLSRGELEDMGIIREVRP